MVLVLLSGKRFVGKDTIGAKLGLVRVSVGDTMKRAYMKKHPEVDLFDREQKEKHRIAFMKENAETPMIDWIKQTPYVDDCVVTDIRTQDEIDFLTEKFGRESFLFIRIAANSEPRKLRGWEFNEQIDNDKLETAFDEYEHWDGFMINNQPEDIQDCADQIKDLITEAKSDYFELGYGLQKTRKTFNGVQMVSIKNVMTDIQRRTFALMNMIGLVMQKGKFTDVLAIESGGYAFGALIAHTLHLRYVPTRKAGKLPPPVHTVSYSMEYRAENSLEISKDSFSSDSKVLIVDDFFATGGTINAAKKLVQLCGAEAKAALCIGVIQINDKFLDSENCDIPVIRFCDIYTNGYLKLSE